MSAEHGSFDTNFNGDGRERVPDIDAVLENELPPSSENDPTNSTWIKGVAIVGGAAVALAGTWILRQSLSRESSTPPDQPPAAVSTSDTVSRNILEDLLPTTTETTRSTEIVAPKPYAILDGEPLTQAELLHRLTYKSSETPSAQDVAKVFPRMLETLANLNTNGTARQIFNDFVHPETGEAGSDQYTRSIMALALQKLDLNQLSSFDLSSSDEPADLAWREYKANASLGTSSSMALDNIVTQASTPIMYNIQTTAYTGTLSVVRGLKGQPPAHVSTYSAYIVMNRNLVTGDITYAGTHVFPKSR